MNHTLKPFGKFLLLWSGELISAIGGGLTSFGLGVYVYQQSGMASHVSFVMLLAFLPSLLLSAPAGVLADHYDRRILMILGDSLSAIGPLCGRGSQQSLRRRMLLLQPALEMAGGYIIMYCVRFVISVSINSKT